MKRAKSQSFVEVNQIKGWQDITAFKDDTFYLSHSGQLFSSF